MSTAERHYQRASRRASRLLDAFADDIQAQMRRILLKWRDSGAERLLLVIADTDANRRVLRTFPEYFSSLPRLKRSTVIAQLEAGVRPEIGFVLF